MNFRGGGAGKNTLFKGLSDLKNFRFNRKKYYGFTLSEVLITLGIIGIVAAMTLPSIIGNIKNKGYIERLKKSQSLLQNATNLLLDELGGDVSALYPDAYYMENGRGVLQNIVNQYASKMKVVHICGFNNAGAKENACNLEYTKYIGLNNQVPTHSLNMFYFSYPIMLTDGSSINFHFKSNPGGGYFWGYPNLVFAVDVNGKSRPNQFGRDIFLLYLNEKGQVLPLYMDGKIVTEDDCNKNGFGFSCAYKVLTTGKMDY